MGAGPAEVTDRLTEFFITAPLVVKTMKTCSKEAAGLFNDLICTWPPNIVGESGNQKVALEIPNRSRIAGWIRHWREELRFAIGMTEIGDGPFRDRSSFHVSVDSRIYRGSP